MHIITQHKQVNDFISDLAKKLTRSKAKFIISPSTFVQADGLRCNGYFDESPPVLAIAIGKPQKQWLPTLVHESCHFDQWKEGIPLWKEVAKYDSLKRNYHNWIDGTELSKTEVTKVVNVSRDLELDCERRTLIKIKKLGLPIDVVAYTKSAAAYVLFYNYIKMSRKWYKIGKEPYNNPEILKLMPDNLDGDFTKLSKKLVSLFEQCV